MEDQRAGGPKSISLAWRFEHINVVTDFLSCARQHRKFVSKRFTCALGLGEIQERDH
jgi:hypothetical protein